MRVGKDWVPLSPKNNLNGTCDSVYGPPQNVLT